MRSLLRPLLLAASLLSASGCSSTSGDGAAPAKTDADYQADVTHGMHDLVMTKMQKLHDAILAMQTAAPDHAWDATADASAIAAMKSAWTDAREAYESIDGPVAQLFVDDEARLDVRYDDVLNSLGQIGDPDLFDDQGMTGLHAIERILYADQIPMNVVDFESSLPGYVAASFPVTDEQATELKTKLLAQCLADADDMMMEWLPSMIDLSGTYQGLVALMTEQGAKTKKASVREQESRYSGTTLRDLRANLAAIKDVYALFRPWVISKSSGGTAADQSVMTTLAALDSRYDGLNGDAVPDPPGDWNALHPEKNSMTDQMSPFGVLYQAVTQAIDPTVEGSVVSDLNAAVTVLGHGELVAHP